MLVRLLSCALALLAAGCASINPPPPVDVLPTEPPRLAPAPQATGPASGSLFNSATYRPVMEDQRARFVGDLVTIEILETIDAKQNSQSNVGRTSKNSGSITALPLLAPGAVSKIAGRSGIGAGYDSDFSGKGDTSSTNQFKSSVTAIVSEVLPNGNLVIQGSQEVRTNAELRQLTVSGIVRPEDISSANTIRHSQIAEARISYGGRGDISAVQKTPAGQALLQRFQPF